MNGALAAQDLQGGARRYASTFEERFWRKVRKTDTCWLWPNPKENGYGETYRNGRTVYAHRAAYVLVKGPIADGHQVDHLCKVRNCVRPDHLEAVSPQENNARSTSPSAQNLAKDQCPQGHPYDQANTYMNGRKRACRICRNEIKRRHRKRKVVSDGMSHGKVSTYSAGCRCDPCREAKRIKNHRERSNRAAINPPEES